MLILNWCLMCLWFESPEMSRPWHPSDPRNSSMRRFGAKAILPKVNSPGCCRAADLNQLQWPSAVCSLKWFEMAWNSPKFRYRFLFRILVQGCLRPPRRSIMAVFLNACVEVDFIGWFRLEEAVHHILGTPLFWVLVVWNGLCLISHACAHGIQYSI